MPGRKPRQRRRHAASFCRSPRHLRVSGQRRRRYRDERYPLQSMPLAGAFASPEMASGKVWVSYPVAQVEEAEVQTEAVEQAPVVAAAVEQHSVTVEDTQTAASVNGPAPEAAVETANYRNGRSCSRSTGCSHSGRGNPGAGGNRPGNCCRLNSRKWKRLPLQWKPSR